MLRQHYLCSSIGEFQPLEEITRIARHYREGLARSLHLINCRQLSPDASAFSSPFSALFGIRLTAQLLFNRSITSGARVRMPRFATRPLLYCITQCVHPKVNRHALLFYGSIGFLHQTAYQMYYGVKRGVSAIVYSALFLYCGLVEIIPVLLTNWDAIR